MRRSLAGISVAVTTLVAVAFLVPLTLLVGAVVRDRAVTDAFRVAAAVGPVLASTSDRREIRAALDAVPAASGRTAVYLPAAGGDLTVIGAPLAPRAAVLAAVRDGRAGTADTASGRAVLQPVALPGARVALIEVDVDAATLDHGVPRARLLLAGLALLLVAGSVALADRLAGRVVRAAAGLGTAAGRLGGGDLGVRVTPQGPPELREAGRAFNTMADRIGGLLTAERERAADLSHRLRTPLAGLVLTGRSLGPGPVGDQVRALTARLEEEVDAIIRQARDEPVAAGPGGATSRCDAAAVIRERLDFWGALAEDQGRGWRMLLPPGEVEVPVPAGDLAAVVDALVGNVFLHTPDGAPFEVRLARTGAGVEVCVADGGTGIADPDRAVRRGASGAGSSGLGLDIVGQVARRHGGRLDLGRSDAGGARVTLVLPPEPDPPPEAGSGSLGLLGRRRAARRPGTMGR